MTINDIPVGGITPLAPSNVAEDNKSVVVTV